MKIKAAADCAGLTTRAVRVYIDAGLLAPETIVYKGRNFVEFADSDVERLRTIAALRDAMLSIPQIKQILDEPHSIGEVFSTYREELRRDYGELSELVGRVDVIDVSRLACADDLRFALAGVKTAEVARLDPLPEPKLYEARPGACDDGISRDERRIAYENWRRKQEKRDRFSFLTDWIYKIERRHVKLLALLPLAIILLAILGYNIGNLHTHTPVSLELDGYEIVPGVGLPAEPVTVKVDGYYENMLFKDDFFFGTIAIENFELRDSLDRYTPDYVKVTFREGEPGFASPNLTGANGMLFYFKRVGENGRAEIRHVRFGEGFTSFAAVADRGDGFESIIVAPADSAEYAEISAASLFPREQLGDAYLDVYCSISEGNVRNAG